MKKKLFNRKVALRGSAVLMGALLFFGTSLSIQRTPEKKSSQSEIQFTAIKIAVESLSPLLAAGASDWDGVRGVATLSRAVVRGVNATLQAFEKAGVFNYSGTEWTTTQNGRTYRLRTGQSVTSDSYSPFPGKSYAYSFEVWSGSNKYIEFLFNNPSAGSASDVMVIIQSANDPDNTDTISSNAKALCQSTGSSGSREMICSLGSGDAGGYNTAEEIQAVRIHVQEQGSEDNLDVSAIARTTSLASDHGCGLGVYYYGLAYTAGISSPHYTTAIQSWVTSSPMDRVSCWSSYEFPAGFFNADANPDNSDSDQYFVGTNSSTEPSSDYPTIASVRTLFDNELTSSAAATTSTGASGLSVNDIDYYADTDFANYMAWRITDPMPTP